MRCRTDSQNVRTDTELGKRHSFTSVPGPSHILSVRPVFRIASLPVCELQCYALDAIVCKCWLQQKRWNRRYVPKQRRYCDQLLTLVLFTPKSDHFKNNLSIVQIVMFTTLLVRIGALQPLVGFLWHGKPTVVGTFVSVFSLRQ